MTKIYEYVSPRGRGAISDDWRPAQQVPQQAALDNDLKRIEQVGLDALPGLIVGPLRGYRHLYKLSIGGKIRLRPILCKGPQDKNGEITLLLGAVERDGTLVPADALEKAERRRQQIEN